MGEVLSKSRSILEFTKCSDTDKYFIDYLSITDVSNFYGVCRDSKKFIYELDIFRKIVLRQLNAWQPLCVHRNINDLIYNVNGWKEVKEICESKTTSLVLFNQVNSHVSRFYMKTFLEINSTPNQRIILNQYVISDLVTIILGYSNKNCCKREQKLTYGYNNYLYVI